MLDVCRFRPLSVTYPVDQATVNQEYLVDNIKAINLRNIST